MPDLNKILRMPSVGDCSEIVILADGDYPSSDIAASVLSTASRSGRVVCCDGAAMEYIARGGHPYAIVGDCDSIDESFRKGFLSILHCDPDQETNDLTKAVKFCVGQGIRNITILGATGKREDHTIANVSLLADYMRQVTVRMITDSGVFDPVVGHTRFESFEGQQVSIFTFSPDTLLTTENLAYPLHEAPLSRWWQGSLNRSEGSEFGLHTTGAAIVYRCMSPCR